ncbi:hypothetical protein [Cognatilysobacter segetis]|uniref:hypothetical protein n=1 Tax=Cognatilysobacter segetis TaxID=2492394 RepID=UPI00138FBD97|nr:hypothetical protein [Lysobacter segetis]
MCRSAFFRTLAGLLAGTHAVGPLPIDGLPTEARCKAPPRDAAGRCAARAPAAATCR